MTYIYRNSGQKVSVLCASQNSIYHSLLAHNIEVYDRIRDARTFPGNTPIIAHPPCRGWSVKLKHQAKPKPGEKELGLWCCEQLLKCGGILEQPAFSELFAAAGFPRPGIKSRSEVWTVNVDQSWWGYPIRKQTWLAIVGIPRHSLRIPYRPHESGNDARLIHCMSKKQRSATTKEFAMWLINAAKQASPRK